MPSSHSEDSDSNFFSNLSNKEWKKRLTPNQYKITREGVTERAFTGNYLNNKESGIYSCICCHKPLFTSYAKFDSGSGWPSFWDGIDKEAISERKDSSFGMLRIEINCSSCQAHLGHVFDDGPYPTGKRYCVNSASLNFKRLEP